jgi:hypothetical protein
MYVQDDLVNEASFEKTLTQFAAPEQGNTFSFLGFQFLNEPDRISRDQFNVRIGLLFCEPPRQFGCLLFRGRQVTRPPFS